MNRFEFDDAIAVLFLGHPKPGPQLVEKFWRHFQAVEAVVFNEAIMRVEQSETFGGPKISDIWREIKAIRLKSLPLELSVAPESAPQCKLALLIRRKVEVAYPDYSGAHQFKSPEDMASHLDWLRIQRRKLFVQLYAQAQQEAKSLIVSGCSVAQAVLAIEAKNSGDLELENEAKSLIASTAKALSFEKEVA